MEVGQHRRGNIPQPEAECFCPARTKKCQSGMESRPRKSRRHRNKLCQLLRRLIPSRHAIGTPSESIRHCKTKAILRPIRLRGVGGAHRLAPGRTDERRRLRGLKDSTMRAFEKELNSWDRG